MRGACNFLSQFDEKALIRYENSTSSPSSWSIISTSSMSSPTFLHLVLQQSSTSEPRPLPSQPLVLVALLVVLVALFLMGFLVRTPTPWLWVNFIKSNHVVVVFGHSPIVALSAITRFAPLLYKLQYL
jgi:hypothetical protein